MIKNLKVAGKLWLIIIPTMATLIGLLVFFAINSDKIITDSKRTLYDEVFISTAEILNADRDFYQAAIAETEYVLSADVSFEKKQELLDSVDENAAQVQERISDAIENIKGNGALFSKFVHPSDNKTLEYYYNDFQTNFKAWQESYQVKTGVGDLGARQVFFNKTRDNLNLMTELLEEYANIESERSFNQVEKSIVFSVAIVSVIILLIAGLSIYILRYLRTSINYVANISKRISDGELSIKIDEHRKTKDEIGQLTIATGEILSRLNGYVGYISEITGVLDQMAEGNMRVELKQDYVGEFAPIKNAMLAISSSLGSILSMINASAEQVNNSASQISAGAQSLSQSSTEQANSIEILAGTIDSVSQEADRNTANVDTAATNMKKTISKVDESTHHMDAMLKAMNVISDTSGKIKSIISMIDNIAFQTNILALNAAVEAARAGQSGKGFAVVANEVKELARKSAEAAQQTSEMIETSLHSVNDGINITNNTAAALTDVFENVKIVNSLVDEIAKSSKVQSEEISSVKVGITQISQTILTNTATAEESAAASEELSAQAQLLYDSVKRFKLN